ncbi:MAG: glycoside hydrolase family 5 protein [bacterium]|nr:glycoside hydrolase family 5 protein [bacterium]
MRPLWGSLLLMIVFTTVAWAPPQVVPEPVVPAPFGVNIHFTRAPERELELLREGGFRTVRMDLFWHEIEKQKGAYDFSDYDVLVRDMTARGIRILFILDYSNQFYDEGVAPYTDEGRAAFARYVEAAVKRYAGKGILWEIWNEPNIYPFWRPKPNVEDYAQLAHVVIDTIRRVAPGEFIVAPASSGFPWEFFETLGQRGVLQRLDAVTVHPYRPHHPETAGADYRRLRLLLDRYSPRKYLPILSGEWGYSDIWTGMDMQKQARYLVRQWLTNLTHDVFLSIWYDWKNDGEDPKEPEHHFGTVYHDLRPKPAYLATKTLTSTLDGYRYLRRLALPNPEDYLLLFRKGDSLALAAWTAGEPHPITLNLPRGTMQVVDLMGKTRSVAVSGAPFVLDLSQELQYLLLPAHADLSLVGAWSPVRQLLTVRAGRRESLPVRVHNPTARRLDATLRARADEEVLGQVRFRLQPGEQRVVNLPIQIRERGEEQVRVTLEWVSPQPNPLHTASVWLGVANVVHLQLLPPAGQRVMVGIREPNAQGLQATLHVRAGGQESRLPIRLERGQREAMFTVQMPQRLPPDVRLSAQLVDERGEVLARSGEVRWVQIGALDADSTGWRAWADGDAKVEAKVEATVADAPEPNPLGVRRAVRLDYRFARGWRFAQLNLPPPFVPIEGKPKAVGMWVYGDGSGNLLRCRITDSGGQTFQPDYGAITWKGWRFVTMRLDGGFPGFWGGAQDGVVRYPIRWESVVLVDSNQESADKDWSLYMTGFALQY